MHIISRLKPTTRVLLSNFSIHLNSYRIYIYRLKLGIDQLKGYSFEVGKIEQKKKQAVGEEDYDTAAQLKQEADKIRIHALSHVPGYPGIDNISYDIWME